MLNSCSWKMAWPYRLVKQKVKDLVSRLPANDRLPPADEKVADLARKLWEGFSQYARKDLEYVLHNTHARADRALAAWELAKLHAVERRWTDVLHYLEISRNSNWHPVRHESTLLYIEALIACGRSKEAEVCARSGTDSEQLGSECCCALSNVLAAQAVRPKRDAAVDIGRLALLNATYLRENLTEVGLYEVSRGFVFGNLVVPEGRLSALHRSEKISVLLCVYNAEPTLRVVISSILEQTWQNVELIVIDDASTDSSWAVVEHLARQDSRIIAVRNATSMGPYQARNKALSMSTGQFIATVDSHGWCHPQMLQLCVETMLAEPVIRLVFPGTVRVSPHLTYALNVGESGTKYVSTSSRSLVTDRKALQVLDRWDGVLASADEEFVQRSLAIWSDNAAREILPGVPLSLCLELPESSGSSAIAEWGPSADARCEYLKQASYWRETILLPAMNAGQTVRIDRVSAKQPFPVPGSVAAKPWRTSHYNLIIISDLTLLGGTRRCNEGYVEAATGLGFQVGLLHWARYDLKLADDIAREYRVLSYNENVDILTADDKVSADLVLIHHPPIMNYLPDAVPSIKAKHVAVLVNQLPERFGEESNPYYSRCKLQADCSRLFGIDPIWIPISPFVRRILSEQGFSPLAKGDWIPPLGKIVIDGPNRQPGGHRGHRVPVIGRHSRDHRTKWPETERDLRAAYCADSDSPVRFLGGAKFARGIVGRWPDNWQELPFDSMRVCDFLSTLDYFVHFTHSEYVEEFGRNVMEAMAAGIPAIVPPRFKEVFADAACYADPEDVEELIRTMWGLESAHWERVEQGLDFVQRFASNGPVEQRLSAAIDGVI